MKKEIEQLRRERMRGWIISILYAARPDAIEMHSLMIALDKRNFPTSRNRLGAEVDHLRSIGLVRVFPNSADQPLNDVAQAMWIQRYVDADSDSEMPEPLLVRISRYGVEYQEGNNIVQGCEIKGIQRVT